MLSETVVQTRHGAWEGDFWEHAAVVRELARHPLHPSQPILAVDAPHAFFSPYALVLGVVARVAGASAITVLGVAGLVNLVLLLVAIPRFVRVFAPARLAPFFALLFTLVLWGPHPLVYSGFLHLDVLGLVLPYPSTFATALALGAVVLWRRQLLEPRPLRLAGVCVIAAVVLLTHPVAALFLGVSLAALCLHERRGAAALGVVWVVAFAAAAAWPWYPFFRLLGDEGVYDPSNRPLYTNVLPELLPISLGLVVLALRLRRDRRDALALAFAAFGAIYGIGWATSHWSLGRVLSYGVLLLHVALAGRMAAALPDSRAALAAAAAVFAVAFFVMRLHDPLVRALPAALVAAPAARPQPVADLYRPLLAGVPAGAVVLAPADVGWPVPAFGPRIVDPLHPQAFVRDLAVRQRDTERFFGRGGTAAWRRGVLCRYRVSYVLTRELRLHAVHPSCA